MKSSLPVETQLLIDEFKRFFINLYICDNDIVIIYNNNDTYSISIGTYFISLTSLSFKREIVRMKNYKFFKNNVSQIPLLNQLTIKPINFDDESTIKKNKINNINKLKPHTVSQSKNAIYQSQTGQKETSKKRNSEEVNRKKVLEDTVAQLSTYKDFSSSSQYIFSNIPILKHIAITIDDNFDSINLFYKLHTKLYVFFDDIMQNNYPLANEYLNTLKPIYEQSLNRNRNKKCYIVQKILMEFNTLNRLVKSHSPRTSNPKPQNLSLLDGIKSGHYNTENFEVYNPNYQNKMPQNINVPRNRWPENIKSMSIKINKNALLAFIDLSYEKLKKRRYGIPNWEIVISDDHLIKMGFNTIILSEINQKCICKLVGENVLAEFTIPSELTDNMCFNYAYAYCLVIFVDTITSINGFSHVRFSNKNMLKLIQLPHVYKNAKTKQKSIKYIPKKTRILKVNNNTIRSIRPYLKRGVFTYVPWHLRILPAGKGRSIKAVKKAEIRGINLLSDQYKGMTFVSEYIKSESPNEEFNKKMVYIRSMSIYSFLRSVFNE